MRFACLGSGSRGNAWLVQKGSTLVMVDCGFGLAETTQRLARRGVAPEAVSAIVLTHEHSDHARGAARFAARHGCALWMTHGCWAMFAATGDLPAKTCLFDPDQRLTIGELELMPYPIPHDAREPVQYVFSDGRVRLGMVSDAGHVTAHMAQCLDACDALVLECNHDIEQLRQGSYPPSLKARILGRYGHLDNRAAAGLLASLDTTRLKHVVAAHLSEENNTPALARAALAEALGCRPEEIAVADQANGLDWRQIA